VSIATLVAVVGAADVPAGLLDEPPGGLDGVHATSPMGNTKATNNNLLLNRLMSPDYVL